MGEQAGRGRRGLRNPAAGQVAGLLIVGLAVRLALLPVGGHGYDLPLMQRWAERLAERPLPRFYGGRQAADHLPGDLWLLWAAARVNDLVAPGAPLPEAAIKLVPVLADGAVGALLFLIGRRLAGSRAGLLAAACYLLNPAPIFLSAVWGQWDAVPAAFALVAVWLAVRGNPAWALPPLVWAALIKPPYAALAPPILLAVGARITPRPGRTGDLARLGLAAAASAALAAALLLPFGIGWGPVPGRWDLAERLRYALDLYPEAAVNAFTLWATPLAGNRTPDSPLVLGVPVRVWGMALFAAAYVSILVRYWRRPTAWLLVWAAYAIAFAAFVLPTRVHERYLLPAVALAAPLVALAPRLGWCFGALSATFLANLAWAYGVQERALGREFGPAILYETDVLVFPLALANVVLLGYALTAMPSILGAAVDDDKRRDDGCDDAAGRDGEPGRTVVAQSHHDDPRSGPRSYLQPASHRRGAT